MPASRLHSIGAPVTPTDNDRLSTVERDTRDHAKSISEFTRVLIDLDKKEAVRSTQEKHLDERLDRIEHSIAGIYRLGWWILGAFGTSAVALIANFAFRGGFIVS